MISYLKNHPVATSLVSALSGWLSVWLSDVDQLAAWAAFLFSMGSFIVIAPKVWANLCAFARLIRRRTLRALVWGIRRLRR